MHPDRVARILAILGIYLLLTVLGLRVISLVTIIWQDRIVKDNAPVGPILPALSSYTLSPDGRQVIFQKQVEINGGMGWFSMPFAGGPATPSEAPVIATDPFLVKKQQLFLLESGSYRQIKASPRDTRVGAHTRSPDGHSFAFAAYRPGGTSGLYILSETGKLDWLGDQDQITALAWSPDSLELAFIARSKGMSQLFVAMRDGQNLRQITTDPEDKSSPRWSPDGRMIAYIATRGESILASTPTPAGPPPHGPLQPVGPVPSTSSTAIAVIDADGANLRMFPQDQREIFTFSWGMNETGLEVAYALPRSRNGKIQYLFGLNPTTGQIRRVYPPQEITALECPTTIPANGTGTVQISITNSALQPADVHVLLRASPQNFPSAGKMDEDIIRSENVKVLPGTSQAVNWPVSAQPGNTTYISVLINPSTTLPMDEKRCTAWNIFSNRLPFLPNLPYLPLMLPLSSAGLLLCIPWLRRQKKPGVWVLYLVIPLLIITLLIIEGWLVWIHLS